MYITHCRDCVFAKFKDNTQVGCQYDRIQRYQALGIPVNTITEGEKTYFTINAFCNHCVTAEVWEKTPNRETSLYNYTCIKNTFIIIDEANKNFADTYNDLLHSCNTAIFSEIRPKNLIYILVNSGRFTTQQNIDLINLLQSVTKGTGINYQSSLPLNEGNWNDYLYAVKNNIKTDYFSIFRSGFNISPYFNSHLNNILNVDVTNFIVATPSDGENGWTTNKRFLESFGWHNPTFCGQAIINEAKLNVDIPEIVHKLIIDGTKIDFYAKPTISDCRNS